MRKRLRRKEVNVMPGKMRPSLRLKTLANVMSSNLSATDKNCIKYVFKAFEKLTSTEVVEVVRCEKCKYIRLMSDGKTLACIRQSAYKKPTDFCSYGERKDA